MPAGTGQTPAPPDGRKENQEVVVGGVDGLLVGER